MDQDRIWDLLSKQVAGEATPGEQEELEWAFLANPGLRDTLEFIKNIKQTPPPGHWSGEEDQLLERGLSRFAALSIEEMGDREYKTSPFLSDAAPVQAPMQLSDQGASMGSSPAGMSAGSPAGTGTGNQAEMHPGNRAEMGTGNLGEVNTSVYPETEKDSFAVRLIHVVHPYRWLAAASIAVILATGALIFHRSGEQRGAPPVAMNVLPKEEVAPRGVRSYADLPDGSKLWLNAGSKIEYVAGFGGNKRELTLFGEAFFDIKHDPDHPFIIHAGKLDIRVLGTSLDVKAYPGDSTLETTLIKGRVEVGLAGDPGSKILLHPSEKVVIRAGITSLPAHAMAGSYNNISGIALSPQFIRHLVKPDSAYGTIVETSWVENKIVFRNKSLAELAGQLERWYNVRIQFDNNKYNEDRVSGSFKDSPIENIMKALQITTGLHYRISGDVIRVW